jgi:21S rRNA (uridine2791-2'-O)-methyltransferase
VQEQVKRFLSDPNRGRPHQQFIHSTLDSELSEEIQRLPDQKSFDSTEQFLEIGGLSLSAMHITTTDSRKNQLGKEEEKMVDIVLSDMSAPWDQLTGFWKRSLSIPYNRMMNTSGINFKDHVGSMVRSSSFYSLLSPLLHLCRLIVAADN